MNKKFFALLMAVVLVIGLLPASVLAADEECAHTDRTKIVQTAATCTEDGYYDCYKCNDCGKLFTKMRPGLNGDREYPEALIPAQGHDWSNKDGVCARSECGIKCTESHTEGVCATCGYTVATECTHPNMEKTVVEATCYEEGYTLYTCSDCGESFKHNPTEALNHPNMEKTGVEATCYEGGYTL